MEEQFDKGALLDRNSLRSLLVRKDFPSRVRLTLHWLAFIALLIATTSYASNVFVAFPLCLALAWVWCTLFAPFHESTHGSAFSRAGANRVAAWFTSFPFLMAPSVYRTFHFEHHRHTQDPELDPELLGKPSNAQNPITRQDWLILVSGIAMIRAKLQLVWFFSFTPQAQWPQAIPWSTHCRNPGGMAQECRLLLGAWLVVGFFVLIGLPGSLWIVLAWWSSHVFLMLWISAEHTGLPNTGSIVSRTRTVGSNRFVRWWLWNMNFHAEHHAWPGMPWHNLPAANAAIASRLEATSPNYTRFHRNAAAGDLAVK